MPHNEPSSRAIEPAHEVRPFPLGIIGSEQVRRWAEARFDRALLILGDSTEPLLPHSSFWAVFERTSEVPLGLAVRFDGFENPVVSVAADSPQAFSQLLDVTCRGRTILALSTKQRLPSGFQAGLNTVDAWLVATCMQEADTGADVEPLHDEIELGDFYAEQDMRFWCQSMFRAGHAFGIRGLDRKLICAGGVNFILPSLGYAQIGALATHPSYRGRSYASRVLTAIRSSLAQTGIRFCGLFADAYDPQLPFFYSKRGFSERGGFRFIEHISTWHAHS
jgi:GNAT superfamily N-acetyltransferase